MSIKKCRLQGYGYVCRRNIKKTNNILMETVIRVQKRTKREKLRKRWLDKVD